ncbi:MAG TPA: GAP family protein [Chitinophagales bacterium]|nr:GAP family protein [Rickettsiaceae bacterium]HND46601.1 GAP family protein [Chitinophagales bacterium]
MTNIPVLPLSLTVMLGPQILVAVLLITRKDPIKSSVIYITAVLATLILTTFIYYELASLIGLKDLSIAGRPLLKHLLIILFIYLIIRSIKNRNNITEAPKWMQNITSASLRKIFVIGLTLIAIMPTDIIATFSVGSILNSNSQPFIAALPFFGAVALIAGLPLLAYLSLGKKGPIYLEQFNTWLNTNGYLINVIVLIFFIMMMIK